MIRRREFITLLGGAAAWPVAANAQQLKRVGVLMNDVETDATSQGFVAAFIQQLKRLGWIDGQNLHVDYRWNGGNAELARCYAAELVALSPDAILSVSTNNLSALQRLSPITPIVFVQVSDPVAQGFVLSLARPGGNITGFAAYEFTIGGKWLDLLKQLVPTIDHVGVMFNPKTSPQSQFWMRSVEAAAPKFGISLAVMPVQNPEEIEPAIASFARRSNGGLVFPTDSFTVVHRKVIINLAARYRVPAIYPNSAFVRDGGLIRYGPEYEDQFRQAGVYVDRILKGGKAADLPVQAPIRYSLIINLKAARDLGIEVPLGILLIADEQID
jgi:putative ABC transport system substrate-binding protein